MCSKTNALGVKTLIIIANPSKESFSHAMADAYSKKCEEFEILDLYDVNQTYLNYSSMKELYSGNILEAEKRDSIQEKITNADEMVFFFPVWWGWVPAILKNFFDTNFSVSFAFNYKNWKSEGLLKWKTAKVFTTCDAPKMIYSFPFFAWINLKKFLNKTTFDFCGIKLTEFKMVDKLHSLSEEKRKEILKKI